MAVLRPAGDYDRSYEQDMAIIRKPWQWVLLGLSLAVLFWAPQWGNAYITAVINQIGYTIIALQGLNLLTGYTGQISLGQAAFMMVGGYASGLLAIHWNFPIYLSLPVGAIITGLIGLIFGLPSLRVKGFYLAMATLAAQFIIPWLTRQPFLEAYLGGTAGFIGIPSVQLFGINFGEQSNFVYITLVVLLITTILTVNITRTRLGRALVAIRDNDLAAELLGVNLFAYKLRAFFLAAMLAGVAGALRAHSERGVGTEFGYTIEISILFLGMLVIGGLGTNSGPFLGGISVILLDDFAIRVGGFLAETFPDQSAQLESSFRPIFFGLVLVVFLIYEPRGLARLWTLMKAGWRLRPFSR
jgi:branched-chain amino acid transport system permease protein